MFRKYRCHPAFLFKNRGDLPIQVERDISLPVLLVPIGVEEETPFGGTAQSHVYTSLATDTAWTMHIVGTSSALAVHKKNHVLCRGASFLGSEPAQILILPKNDAIFHQAYELILVAGKDRCVVIYLR